MKIGIIPAAGKAERFGGVAKELLVTRDGITLLEHAVNQLSFCDQIIVITTQEKMLLHSAICGDRDCVFTLQKGDGFVSAIFSGLKYNAEKYFIVMPDTVFSPSMAERIGEDADLWTMDFYVGIFYTRYARRFGIKIGSLWQDKPNLPDIDRPFYPAWGYFGLSGRMRERWMEMRDINPSVDIPDLMTYASQNGNSGEYNIQSYHDMATIEDYKEYLCS